MKFDNEKDALAAWDKEYGENQEDEFVGQTMSASIKDDPSGGIGIVVNLPNTKHVAYMMALSIIQTMSASGGETFDEVVSIITSLNDKNTLQSVAKF
jgi:hypothetical protein